MIRIKATPPAFIVLSETMLNKAIIDANGTIRQFGRLFGIDFDEMEAGDRKQVEAEFLDGTPTTLSFYKTRNRGDRRFSIKGIKKQAGAGDTVALTFRLNKGRTVMVINVTRNPEYAFVLEAAG